MVSSKKEQENLVEWLQSLPDEYVECRDLRHAWGGAQEAWSFGYGFRGRVLLCRRCGVLREQMIDKAGKIVVSRYIGYGDDYQKPANTPAGRVPSAVVREESLSRADFSTKTPGGLAHIFDHMTKKRRG